MVRVKQRYILGRVEWFDEGNKESPRDGRVLLSGLRAAIQTLYGEFGLGFLRSMAVKNWVPSSGSIVIRVPRERIKMALSVIALIDHIGSLKCAIRVLHVGGSLHLTSNAALRFDRDLLAALSDDSDQES